MQAITKVVFVSYYGVGDLFNSREFVKDIMRQTPDKEHFYVHGKPENIFEDIPLPKWKGRGEIIATCPTKIIDDALFINTWIGRDSKYVLPGIGCKIYKNKEMFNDMLGSSYGIRLEGDGDYYWPKIQWNRVSHLDRVVKWLGTVPTKKHVIISNGVVNSSQSENFDFTPIIEKLVRKYPDTPFIETHRTGIKADNLFFSGDITGDVGGVDVNQIAFLALGSKLVVGRSSGTFTCCMTADFMKDFNRKALTFVSHSNAGYFIDNPIQANAKLVAITDMSDPLYHIERMLNE